MTSDVSLHIGAPGHTRNHSPSNTSPSTSPTSASELSSTWAPLVALCSIARIHQVAADPATLAHQLGIASTDTIGTTELLRAAQHLGLKAKHTQSTIARLGMLPLPALATVYTADGSSRVVILAQSDGKRVLYQDVAQQGSGPTIEPIEINRIPTPSTWTSTLHRTNDASGFEAIAFVKEGSTLENSPEIVISFAGTYDKSGADIAAGVALFGGQYHAQLLQAAKYYLDVKAANPNATINDRLIGGVGKDYLNGGDGDDLLFGDTDSTNVAGNVAWIPGEFHAADTLDGGNGQDPIHGDGIAQTGFMTSLEGALHGADFLDGGGQEDTLTGTAVNTPRNAIKSIAVCAHSMKATCHIYSKKSQADAINDLSWEMAA